jgi:site-specific recombinase XerD
MPDSTRYSSEPPRMKRGAGSEEARVREVWNSYKRWMLDDKGYAITTRKGYLAYAQSAHRWLRTNGHTGLPWATQETIRGYWDTTTPTAENRMHVRAALCAFFACLNDLGWRPDNPAASLPKLKRPKRLPRPIMGSDAQKILDVAQAFDPMVCAIVHLFAYCGIRNAELRELKWSHLQGNMLRIHGKGDKERVVAVPPTAMQYLQCGGAPKTPRPIGCSTPAATRPSAIQDHAQGPDG